MKKHAHQLLAILCFSILATSVFAAPIISNVELTSLTDTSMIITWSTTNEASSTELIWGAGGLTNITTLSGTSKYHYVELTGLYQNTTYQYRVKSGNTIFPPPPYFSASTFTTLSKPSGEYLFSFAVLNDLRYAEGKANTQNARGIPYEICDKIISSEVADINRHGVAFTVINGNLAESSGVYGDQVGSNTYLRGKLEQLSGASDLPPGAAYKYLPTTGYQDKKATYSSDWITNAFKPLTTDAGSTESRYGYTAADKNKDSVFNYQFKYKYYNFIFLDAVKNDYHGLASLEALYNYLSAESNSKTFIFMSYPGYNPLDASTKDYPVDIPTSEVDGIVTIDNNEAFRATLEAFEDSSGNPIVAAVVSAHLGDNYKRDINSISYVRQGPALQYPTGYSIYKVYGAGYMKTFYKTTGGSLETDGDTKPYYEYARDLISSEVVSGQTLPKEALTQFWLGSSSNRNFIYTYMFIPGLPPRVSSTAPSSNEAAVSLNSPVLITFNKRMSQDDLNSWVSIASSTETLSSLSASFLDTGRTILKVTHPNFSSNEVYTVTLNASKVKDEGLTTMESNYVFGFNTYGGITDDNPPVATVNPFPNNTTTDPFALITGIATDDSRVIVVQYRFDNNSTWTTAEAVDGEYSGTTEVFQIKPSTALTTGSHQLWLRTFDGAGNSSAEGYLAYSFTVMVGEKPTTSSFKINGGAVYAGDPINTTPRIEVTITSNNSLEGGSIIIDAVRSTLTFVKVDTSYYATFEVTSPLADGTHYITIEAVDISGNATTYEASSLYVQSASAAAVQGVPLNYPNPFDPGTQSTTISYTLSKASNITINIFDLFGNVIYKKSYNSTESGGKAGYNEVSWDGKSSNGNYVGNGIYLYLIIADGQVIQNGKGKITVFKR